MASEDSDQLWSGLLAIHRLRELHDVGEPIRTQMPTRRYELETSSERRKVLPFRRAQRVRPEERDDRPEQVVATAHDIPMKVLSVVVPAPIDQHLANTEELTKVVEAVDALGALRDHELVEHLIAGSVSASARSRVLANEADREASFSVYKASNPASPEQSFLLVFRTDRIVTAHE
jgi:hypothetical protein